MQSRAQAAAALINTRSLPPGLGAIQMRAWEAHAYDCLVPYPLWHFRDWKVEDRGPHPRCMPVAKRIVSRGARWLFGRALQLQVAENEKFEKFLRSMWRKNKMGSRLVAMARKAAIEGGIALKFSYDETARVPLSMQALSIVDQVRLFYSPHNCDELLMARIQYSYFDAAAGKTMWYREEWTDEEEIHYYPIPDDSLQITRGLTGVSMSFSRTDPDTFEGWQIDPDATKPNPFGLIPVVHIKNVETDDTYGVGDLWDLYRVVDRINLTFHLMDRSNQFDAETNPIFIDLDMDENDIDKPLQPGQPMDTESKSETRQGKVEFPPTGNGLRPAMMEYAKELTKQVQSAAATVEVDQAEFSNKGNLTNAVLAQLYKPLIEATEEKRKSWGENGLVEFFGLIAVGLQRLGVDLGVSEKNEDSYAVEIAWPSYFDLSQDELTAMAARTQIEVAAGFLPQDRAIDRVAAANGIQDVTTLKEEIKAQPPPVMALPPAAVTTGSKELTTLRTDGGKDSL